MTEIQVSADLPVSVDKVEITHFTVNQINFMDFCDIVQSAVSDTSNASVEKLMMRGRMAKQVDCHGKDGNIHKLDGLSLVSLPAKYAREIHQSLNAQVEPAGEVLEKGDGITSPVHYKLGTPIKMVDESVIEEVEFIAENYGKIEDVLIENQALLQARALLKGCCVPVSEAKMLSMPDLALQQITVTDGIVISNRVVPSFLD